MIINPEDVGITTTYKHLVSLIVPRPIAWVTTISSAGAVNLAPFSFFSGVGANPPCLLFCPANKRDGDSKDTLRNIEQNGEFVVNVVPAAMADVMNQTSAEYEFGVSEIEALGLQVEPSLTVSPPRVTGSPAAIECSLMQVIHLAEGPGGANIVIGKINRLVIDDEMLNGDGFADPTKLDAIGRMGGQLYTRTTERFALDRPRVD